jgi:hypothetical protein
MTPFIPLITTVLSYFLNLFIKDAKKKEEWRLKVLEAVNNYNTSALDSAKLREEYIRLKQKMKEIP